MLDLVPAGTIGVPDMIHRVVEKIYGEEAALPIQLWEDASGNVAILRGGVEVTDDPMFIKELYDGCESAREILHGALRRGELVLEIEDDAGKRYAIPVTYLDSGAGFDTFGALFYQSELNILPTGKPTILFLPIHSASAGKSSQLLCAISKWS